jgi:hypothetical protein
MDIHHRTSWISPFLSMPKSGPFDARANGVGHYSFTQALTTKLCLLSTLPYFSVGKIYTAIYTRMQSFLMQGIDNERYPPPAHFVLSQDGPFTRAIHLSVRDSKITNSPDRSLSSNIPLEDENSRKRVREQTSGPTRVRPPTQESRATTDMA